MTTFVAEVVTCALCGTKQEVSVLAGTVALGAPNLDLRPPPHAGWAVLRVLATCTACGFTAPDLSKAPSGLSPSAIPRLSGSPTLAGQWELYSRTCALASQTGDAAWAMLRAAWASDDAAAEEAAAAYRLRAVDLFREARAQTAESSDLPASTKVVVIDCLRRAGSFDAAAAAILEVPNLSEPTAATVARFEQALVDAQDPASSTVEDALPRFSKCSDKHIRLHERVRSPGNVGWGDERVTDASCAGVVPEVPRKPKYDFLVPYSRRGRHQQLAMHGLVPLPVVGKPAHHLGGVVMRSCHTHKLGSAWREMQGVTREDQVPERPPHPRAKEMSDA